MFGVCAILCVVWFLVCLCFCLCVRCDCLFGLLCFVCVCVCDCGVCERVYFVCVCFAVVCMCVCGRVFFYGLCVCVVCDVTRPGEYILATSWPTTCVKILSLSFPMTNNADFLEAALTLTDICTSIWNIFKIIFEASIDKIKVLPKRKLAPVTSVPELT